MSFDAYTIIPATNKVGKRNERQKKNDARKVRRQLSKPINKQTQTASKMRQTRENLDFFRLCKHTEETHIRSHRWIHFQMSFVSHVSSFILLTCSTHTHEKKMSTDES